MPWQSISDLDSLASPALLVDADLVQQNIQSMCDVVDQVPSRLRPHVKTHKMPEVIRQQVAAGIVSFKAATLAEAEMVAEAGGQEILIAYPLVGPHPKQLATLTKRYPDTNFACIVDSSTALRLLSDSVPERQSKRDVYIDVDCGMHRTGMELGDLARRLIDEIEQSDRFRFAGLHVYDGHLHDSSPAARESGVAAIVSQIEAFATETPIPAVIAGGSPTFPFWAKYVASRSTWQCSPGTTVFWDCGYGNNFADLDFKIAAALLTRVISKPGERRICLDLGYKAVASEKPLEGRVILPALKDPTLVGQSEEHLVVETESASTLEIGTPLIAIPRHICPTVALYPAAQIIRGGRVTGETWSIRRRD